MDEIFVRALYQKLAVRFRELIYAGNPPAGGSIDERALAQEYSVETLFATADTSAAEPQAARRT